MTRKEARAAGHVTYENGKPCPNGHIGPRYAMSRTGCVQCCVERIAKQRKSGRRAEIDNAYYVRNVDKRKAYGAAYRAKRRAERQGASHV